MDYQEWEFFEDELNAELYTVADPGPLQGPVTSFIVRRSSRLDLVLETTSSVDSRAVHPESVANAVFTANGTVDFRGVHGATATARGVLDRERNTTRTAAGHETVQTSTIQSLHWTCGFAREAMYVTDWVENLSGDFLWPDSDRVEQTKVRSRTLQSAHGEVTIPLATTSKSFGRSCARLSVSGWEIIIGKSRAKPHHIKNPGFILYLGLPDEEIRSRIRQCLSFCLGDYLIHLGSTTFDAEWMPTSFVARGRHALTEDALTISGRPPAPLGIQYEHEVDSALLSQMASRFFDVYDTYNLRNAFWNYWHAVASPVHMTAAHFGAAIEAIQQTYFTQNSNSNHRRIVAEDETWRNLHAQINQCIQNSTLSADEKRMLSNKAQHLNSAPQGVLADRFFAAIGLNLSTLEQDVWRNRNRAAHGGRIPEDRFRQVIRENNVLRTLINRILLSISGGSSSYYDYYTLNRPTRQLSEPVPDDRESRSR